jgi:hypothetical protein
VQFLTGILGGITSDLDHLMHMKHTTERLFGSDCEIFVHGAGLVNLKTAAAGALMGTSIRVGQEDNVTDEPGSCSNRTPSRSGASAPCSRRSTSRSPRLLRRAAGSASTVEPAPNQPMSAFVRVSFDYIG